MALLSFGDLKDAARPTLWALEEMKKIELAEGRTFQELVRDIQAGMVELNNSLLSMTHYSELFSVQDDVELEYPVGVTNGIEEATEYGVPTPRRGATTGHSLPLRKWDRGLGWTMMYLQEARSSKLDADIGSAVQDMKEAWQKHLLTRLFKMEAESVGTLSAASVPLADGGTNDANYVPVASPEGMSFLNTHDHFLRHATLSAAVSLNLAVSHLFEHGFLSPFDIIGSYADLTTWAALTEFKKPEWPGIVYHSSTTERAAIPDTSEYIGYLELREAIVRVYLSPRVPTGYYSMYKKFGPGDPRNPVRIRTNPKKGFGWNIVPGLWVNSPMELAVLYNEYGVGIGENRVNGVCVFINASGDYVTPTIS